ncbi:MAG: metal-sensitive transcriptional regulator [Chloroflexota bacterium]|nr:MAG: metal-sensitive transcriptional regulator [Chloroflexota bacterium]
MAAMDRDKALRDRLRRLEGQIGGTVRMLDDARPCEDILTQLMAARSAIDRAAGELVNNHIDDCLARLPAEDARATVSRAIKMLGKIS